MLCWSVISVSWSIIGPGQQSSYLYSQTKQPVSHTFSCQYTPNKINIYLVNHVAP